MTDEKLSIHDRIMARRQLGHSAAAADPAPLAEASKPKLLRRLLISAGATVLLSGVAFALYQLPIVEQAVAQAQGKTKTVAPKGDSTNSNEQAKPEQAQGQATAPSNADPFTAHSSGLKACSSTYAGLGKILTEGTQFMVQTQTAKATPERHGISGVVGMVFPPNSGAYSGPAAGIVFAAPTADGCEGNMVRVVPFEQSCAVAATLLPQGSEALQPLSTLPIYNLPTGGQAMLMPSGSGCVAITIIKTAV